MLIAVGQWRICPLAALDRTMPKTWNELIALPQFQALTPQEREQVRNAYFDTVVAPQAGWDQYEAARAEFDAQTTPPKPNDSLLGDIPDLLQRGLYNAAGGVADFVGADTPAQWLYDQGKAQLETMTPETQQALQQPLFSEEGDYYLGAGATSPRAWLAQGLDTLGGMALPIPGGALARAALRPLLGLGKAALAAKAGLMAQEGMTAGRATRAAQRLAPDWRDTAANIAGYGGMEALVSGGLAEQQTREQVLAMPQEQLDRIPEYLDALQANDGDVKAARQWLAESLGKEAGWKTFFPTVALGAGAGHFYDKLIGGGGTGSRLKNMAQGAATEALEEAPQSLAEQVAQNTTLQSLDPNIGAFDQAIPNMLTGAALGGLGGGLMAGAMPKGTLERAAAAGEQAAGAGLGATPPPSPEELARQQQEQMRAQQQAAQQQQKAAQQQQQAQQQAQRQAQEAEKLRQAQIKTQQADLELNRKRAAAGLPPIVGGAPWDEAPPDLIAAQDDAWAQQLGQGAEEDAAGPPSAASVIRQALGGQTPTAAPVQAPGPVPGPVPVSAPSAVAVPAVEPVRGTPQGPRPDEDVWEDNPDHIDQMEREDGTWTLTRRPSRDGRWDLYEDITPDGEIANQEVWPRQATPVINPQTETQKDAGSMQDQGQGQAPDAAKPPAEVGAPSDRGPTDTFYPVRPSFNEALAAGQIPAAHSEYAAAQQRLKRYADRGIEAGVYVHPYGGFVDLPVAVAEAHGLVKAQPSAPVVMPGDELATRAYVDAIKLPTETIAAEPPPKDAPARVWWDMLESGDKRKILPNQPISFHGYLDLPEETRQEVDKAFGQAMGSRIDTAAKQQKQLTPVGLSSLPALRERHRRLQAKIDERFYDNTDGWDETQTLEHQDPTQAKQVDKLFAKVTEQGLGDLQAAEMRGNIIAPAFGLKPSAALAESIKKRYIKALRQAYKDAPYNNMEEIKKRNNLWKEWRKLTGKDDQYNALLELERERDAISEQINDVLAEQYRIQQRVATEGKAPPRPTPPVTPIAEPAGTVAPAAPEPTTVPAEPAPTPTPAQPEVSPPPVDLKTTEQAVKALGWETRRPSKRADQAQKLTGNGFRRVRMENGQPVEDAQGPIWAKPPRGDWGAVGQTPTATTSIPEIPDNSLGVETTTPPTTQPPSTSPVSDVTPTVSVKDAVNMPQTELDALLDNIEAEARGPAVGSPVAPTTTRVTGGARTPGRRGRQAVAPSTNQTPVTPETPTPPSLAGAGSNLVAGTKALADGIAALFGGAGTLRSGPAFDEESYAKAKPMFVEAMRLYAEAGREFSEWVKYLLDQAGTGVMPAIRRFMSEVRSGEVLVPGVNDEQVQARNATAPETTPIETETAPEETPPTTDEAETPSPQDESPPPIPEDEAPTIPPTADETTVTTDGGADLRTGKKTKRTRGPAKEERPADERVPRAEKDRGAGTVVVRPMDAIRRALAALRATSLEHYVKNVLNAATPAKVWKIAPREGVTPGATRAQDWLRAQLLGPMEWVGASYGGGRGTRRINFSDAIVLSLKRSDNLDNAKAELEDRIATYIATAEALGAKLSGAANLQQLQEAMAELLVSDDAQRSYLAEQALSSITQDGFGRYGTRPDQYDVMSAADKLGKDLMALLRMPKHPKYKTPIDRYWTYLLAPTWPDSPWHQFVGQETDTINKPIEPKRWLLKEINRRGFEDHRQGRAITSADLMAEFGFAGVPVGSYVTSKDGRLHLDNSFEALHDLATLLGIDPKTDISFGGILHYSIGKLGKGGKASAFFSPNWPIYRRTEDGKEELGPDGMPIIDTYVKAINITKTSGDGSVAHEWGHALDDALSRTSEGKRMIGMIYTALAQRWDVERLEKVLDDILTGAEYAPGGFDPTTKRGRLDGAKSFLENERWARPSYGVLKETEFARQASKLGDYWRRQEELFARSWEAAIYDWMGPERQSDYLVNDFVAEGKISGGSAYLGTPYPAGYERTWFSSMWRSMLDHIEWDEGRPVAKPGFKDPLQRQREELASKIEALKAELNKRYAALNGKQSPDGLYWYAYTEDRRGAGAQPRGYTAFDDSHRQGDKEDLGAVAYGEPLGPEEVRTYLLEPIEHEANEKTVYLDESIDSKTDPRDETVGSPDYVGAEDESAEDVSGAGTGRQPRADGDGGAGDGTGRADAPEGGERPRQPGQGAGVLGDSAGTDGTGGTGDTGAVSTAAGANYRVTSPQDLIPRGPAEAFSDNLRALRLLKELEAEGRMATAEEQAILVKYHGWGGLAKAFKHYNDDEAWLKRYDALRELLTSEEWDAARSSTINANYTDPLVAQAMWETLRRMGFTGGKVLDPAGGAGIFYTMMPQDLEQASRLLYIDKDPLTARLAAHILQKTAVRNSAFEEAKLPERYFDLVVTNVPFADVAPNDKRYNPDHRFLHDYFFLKSIELVRPGGIVAFITSKGTMDKIAKGGLQVRGQLASKADLIGAVRLPENAFAEAGMTTVTTDIVFLRRKAGERDDLTETWLESKEMALPIPEGASQYWSGWDQDGRDEEGNIQGANHAYVNEYYHRHPEMMATSMYWRRGRYGGSYEPAMMPSDQPIGEIIGPLLERLPQQVMVEEGQAAFADEAMYAIQAEVEDVKDGGLTIFEGKVYQKREGMLYPYELKAPDEARVRSYLPLMQARRAVLNGELRRLSDDELAPLRADLKAAYDAFVTAHGALNLKENARAFAEDPDAAAVQSLEYWDNETKTVTQLADIFSQRVVAMRAAPTHADTTLDALAAALNYRGRVDWAYIQSLTGQSFEQAREALRGMVYNDPRVGWVTADAYLSGNVRQKLAEAKAIADVDDAYAENVTALEAVQPKDLNPEQIYANLGANWVEPATMHEFIADLLGLNWRGRDVLLVSYMNTTGQWSVQIGGPNQAEAKRNKEAITRSAGATSTWGTPQLNLIDLLDYALNGGVPKVYRTVHGADRKQRRVVDEPATEAARAKLEEVRTEFNRWLWSDPDRAAGMVRRYNDARNALVLRTYQHPYYVAGQPDMAFPGQNPNDRLRDYQAGAVWRIQQDLDVYLGHEVGVGKTFTMITAGMELRRTGVKKKPMYAVLGSTVPQFKAEFLRLYPNANILTIHIGDNATQRRLALGRIANNNWDAVIVSHDSFNRIPVSPATEMRRITQELRDLEEALTAARGVDTTGGQYGRRGRAPTNQAVKQLEKAKGRMESRLRALGELHQKDQGVSFEDLGVDMLFVDEAQNYKNLAFHTKLAGQVKGLGDPKGSGRAWGLFMKARHIQETFGGGLVLASGTPVSNSVAEVYTIQRYLDHDQLRAAGLHHFDRWAAEYGDIGTASEYAPEGGGFREVVRFRKFHNAPEMLQAVYRRLDVMTAAEAGIPRPAMVNGKPEQIVVPQTEALAAFQVDLIVRAQEVRRNPRQALPDNMLAIVTDGRKAAIDMRLIDPALPDDPQSKTNAAANLLLGEYRRTTGIKVPDPKQAGKTLKVDGVSLVFLDLGVPNSEGRFSVYQAIKDKLVAGGIPAEQIAFAQEATGSSEAAKAKRLAQHAKVKAGKIRVFIGSTDTMGTGVNVQERVSLMLHLDVWWNLSNWLQRNGRGIRYGNLFPEVRVLNIGAERTVDTFVWDKVQQKGVIVDKIMSKNLVERTIKDVSKDTMSAGEAMAVFSGDVRIKRQADLRADVRRLGALRAAYYDTKSEIGGKLRSMKARLNQGLNEAPLWGKFRADLARLVDNGALLVFEPKRAMASAYSFQEESQNRKTWDIVRKLVNSYEEAALAQRQKNIKAIKVREKEWEAKHPGVPLPDKQYPEWKNLEDQQIGVFAHGNMNVTWVLRDKTGINPGRETDNFESVLKTSMGNFLFDPDSTPKSLVRRLLEHITSQNKKGAGEIKEMRAEIPKLEEEYAKPFKHEEDLRSMEEELSNLTRELILETEDQAVVIDEMEDDTDDEDRYSRGSGSAAGISQDIASTRLHTLLGAKVARVLLESGIIRLERRGAGAGWKGETRGDGTFSLNLDALDAGNFDGTLKHEAFHATVRELLGEETYRALMARLDALLKSPAPWVAKARKAVPEKTAAGNVTEEVGAYAIEQFVNGEPQPGLLRRWAEELLSALRTAIIRRLPNGRLKNWALANLQARDLAKLAVAGLRARARGQTRAAGQGSGLGLAVAMYSSAMSDTSQVASTSTPSAAGDITSRPAGLLTVTSPDYAYGNRVPVIVTPVDDEKSLKFGMRFFIDSKGQARLEVSKPLFMNKDYVQARAFRAIQEFLWPFGNNEYFRSSFNAKDYEHIKAKTHRESRNHATDEDEGGLSVSRSIEFPQKYVYLVSGQEIGTGTDSEPLLALDSIQIASKRMTNDEAYDLFENALDGKIKALGLSRDDLRALRSAVDYYFEQSAPTKSGASDTTENFSPANPDIRYSVADGADAGGSPLGGGRAFLESVKQTWADQWTQQLPRTLGALSLRQLAEVGSAWVPGLKTYDSLRTRMETRRNVMMEEAGKLGDAVDSWARAHRVEARAAFELMNDATAAQVDPADFQPVMVPLQLGPGPEMLRNWAATDANVQELRRRVRVWKRSADHRERALAAYYAKAARVLMRAARAEKRRQAASAELIARWEALSDGRQHLGTDGRPFATEQAAREALRAWKWPKGTVAIVEEVPGGWAIQELGGKQVYTRFRDLYKQRSREMMEALIKRIETLSSLTDEDKRALAARIRHEFESPVDEMGNPRIGPYFPFQRFGRWYLFARKAPEGGGRSWLRQDGTPFASPEAAWAALHKRRDLDGVNAKPVKLEDGSGWELREVGEEGFWLFESVAERREAAARMKEEGWEVRGQGLTKEAHRELEGVSEGFVAEAIDKLKRQGSKDEADTLYQLYLQTLQQMSIRKHFMHRKGTKGYTSDQLRAFGWNMTRLAHQVSKLEAMPRMEQTLRDMEDEIQAGRADKEDGDVSKENALLEEVKKRHEWIAHPDNAPWTNAVSALGFMFYLGVSPAAALVNLTQVPIVALPALAARLRIWAGQGGQAAMAERGEAATWGEAGRALTAAFVDVARGFNPGVIKAFLTGRPMPSEAANLTAEERAAFGAWDQSGARDRTQAHNLAGIGDADSWLNGPTFNRVMGAISSLFHAAEVVNRDATLLAAYRLARTKGLDHAAAVAQAEEVTWESHFDYSNANRPRFMQKDVAKALLMFKNYAQHVFFFLGRNLFLWAKGQSPEVRREARTKFAGMVGMTALFAGVSGLPLGAVFALANVIQALFGDDDQPWDAETEWRRLLERTFPRTVADIIDRGAVNKLSGLDFASRVSLSDLIWRSPNRDLDGAGLYQHIVEQVLGPVGGILARPFTMYDHMREGEWVRAAESATPKFMKDLIQAGRFGAEGVMSRKGDEILPRENLSSWELLWKAMGLAPDEVQDRYERNAAVKLYERRIIERRRLLLTAAALARIAKDREALAAAREKIAQFNRANPGYKISGTSIRRSVHSREAMRERARTGIVVNPKLAYLYEQAGGYEGEAAGE